MSRIPTVETYRGVGIHDCQPRGRIERTVKPAIDRVIAAGGIGELLEAAADITKPPEARLLAAAKVQAAYEISAADRTTRPEVNLQYVAACVAGLKSRGWRAAAYYGSTLDVPAPPGEQGHDPRPPKYAAQVEADRLKADD